MDTIEMKKRMPEGDLEKNGGERPERKRPFTCDGTPSSSRQFLDERHGSGFIGTQDLHLESISVDYYATQGKDSLKPSGLVCKPQSRQCLEISKGPILTKWRMWQSRSGAPDIERCR
ncbi:hypothetical protein PoB_001682500 [Plakobranchus ocellatus]|uniref:Uncharacterized protein n=1 Tax=Plakobranchus ocellatus TaxID=259542 RepID=A0AAV3Z4D6_9GAST|nr:hypothetical protein PoB_001682500 [Plakobranchus ocellatus]